MCLYAVLHYLVLLLLLLHQQYRWCFRVVALWKWLFVWYALTFIRTDTWRTVCTQAETERPSISYRFYGRTSTTTRMSELKKYSLHSRCIWISWIHSQLQPKDLDSAIHSHFAVGFICVCVSGFVDSILFAPICVFVLTRHLRCVLCFWLPYDFTPSYQWRGVYVSFFTQHRKNLLIPCNAQMIVDTYTAWAGSVSFHKTGKIYFVCAYNPANEIFFDMRRCWPLLPGL